MGLSNVCRALILEVMTDSYLIDCCNKGCINAIQEEQHSLECSCSSWYSVDLYFTPMSNHVSDIISNCHHRFILDVATKEALEAHVQDHNAKRYVSSKVSGGSS
jgi:hypothetical protein